MRRIARALEGAVSMYSRNPVIACICRALLVAVALLAWSAATSATPRLACPCSVYSSGAPDSTASPTGVKITAGISNAGGAASGPLRLTLLQHDTPSIFNTNLVYNIATVIYISDGIAADGSLPAQDYEGGFDPAFTAGDPALYHSIELDEFNGVSWVRRDRVRMWGRARQGTAIERGGRHLSNQWYGLVLTGEPAFTLDGNSFTLTMPGLKNVSSQESISGNLTLYIRQASTSGSFYTLLDEDLTTLSLLPGESGGQQAVSGSINIVNDPNFDNLYVSIRDAGTGIEYLAFDLPDDGPEPTRRYIDLDWIDFLADTDADNVSDYQEVMALTDPTSAASVPPTPVVRVLVYHSQSVGADFGSDIGAGILHVLESINTIYDNSGINMELELAGLLPVTIDEDQTLAAMLEKLKAASDEFSDLDNQRIANLADLVFGYKPDGPGEPSCGRANLSGLLRFGDMADESYALERSVVGVARSDCPVSTTAHELGHMTGLGHSRPQVNAGGNPGTFDWSVGHGVAGAFYTVMSYVGPWPNAWRVSLFSNPLETCRDEDYESAFAPNNDFASPCGVDRSDVDNGADAALSLNTVAYQVAAFTRDTDGDGTADLYDDDDDGDGTPDASDEAPLDPLSTSDLDLDGISDARDPDIDNDGEPNGSDAFPADRLEQQDTDGDGTGDNADGDDDGDGHSDEEEEDVGSDPKDANSTPGDTPFGLPIYLIREAIDGR